MKNKKNDGKKTKKGVERERKKKEKQVKQQWTMLKRVFFVCLFCVF